VLGTVARSPLLDAFSGTYVPLDSDVAPPADRAAAREERAAARQLSMVLPDDVAALLSAALELGQLRV